MSAEDTVSDAAGAISADRFVEISYDEVIPNNVALGSDKQLQRALEGWRPKYLDWWTGMGPVGFQQSEVYLRTAVGVDPAGWAKFGYVKMPTYRWGILLAPKVEGRTIPFGRHKGEPAWQDVPGEHRALLRRLIVVQGDTEPASVEQQRFLGATAPSLYDMRNLFQVNVEEGRHLWAMVYLLVKYFGRDGREEAQALLERQSGQMDNPRILGAFNERTPDWLSFFMFTFFTDRDGKMQLAALAESGFDPLSRTCRFMLTEEAHHMFVGETGVQRTIEATCAAMVKAGIKDPNEVEAVRRLGVVDLPLLQRKLNFHASVTRDLFGAEISSNAAEVFGAGIKGRFNEANLKGDDHVLQDATYPVTRVVDGKLVAEDAPALRALNARLLDDFIVDCQGGIDRWNKSVEKAGIDFKFVQPHKGFNRRIGEFGGKRISPAGEAPLRRSVEREERRLAAERGRHGLHRLADEAVPRAGQICELDRPAPRRRQQSAGRFRICEDRLRGRSRLRQPLALQRPLDGGAFGHPVAVVEHPGEGVRVDAVDLHPAGDGEEIGVGDRIGLAHRPGPAKHLSLDQIETGADGFRNLLLHRLVRRWIVCPAIAARAVSVRDMHRRAEIGVERLHFRERERIVDRREPRLRMALGDEGENGRRLGQHAAPGHERRHAALRIDLEIIGPGLLGGGEVDPPCLVVRAGLFKRDMRGERTGVGGIVEREHRRSRGMGRGMRPAL